MLSSDDFYWLAILRRPAQPLRARLPAVAAAYIHRPPPRYSASTLRTLTTGWSFYAGHLVAADVAG